jgi:hypothetical protein
MEKPQVPKIVRIASFIIVEFKAKGKVDLDMLDKVEGSHKQKENHPENQNYLITKLEAFRLMAY